MMHLNSNLLVKKKAIKWAINIYNAECLTYLYSILSMKKIFKLAYCYAVKCPAGLQDAVRSRQVHQLKQGTHVGCGLPTQFNITDITNSLAELHFKATRRVIGELLKVNTDNWLAFPLKYKVFDKYNTSTPPKKIGSELPCLGQQD